MLGDKRHMTFALTEFTSWNRTRSSKSSKGKLCLLQKKKFKVGKVMMVSSGVYFGILWGWSKMEKEKHEITSKGTKLSCVRLRASVRSG